MESRWTKTPESGMNIAEYAEYITGKADECRARLEGNP